MSRVRFVDDFEWKRAPNTAEDFLNWLGGPALLRIAGRDRGRTRVVSVLMHGNEPSGLRALHAWLRERELPATDVLAFVGAVEAARLLPLFSHRMVPERPDLNRCFRPPFQGVEGEIAGELLEWVMRLKPEAVVDLHNNTGRNPIYGVSHRAVVVPWKLASLFTHRFVYSPIALATFVEACQFHFPAVTIECGQAGDPRADADGLAGLRRFLHRPRLDDIELAPGAELFLTPSRLYLDPHVPLAFSDRSVPGKALTLDCELDRENFQTVPVGRVIGWLAPQAPWPFRVPGPEGREISHEYFERRGNEVVTRRPWIPIMLTTSVSAALGDCLCYLAEKSRF